MAVVPAELFLDTVFIVHQLSFKQRLQTTMSATTNQDDVSQLLKHPELIIWTPKRQDVLFARGNHAAQHWYVSTACVLGLVVHGLEYGASFLTSLSLPLFFETNRGTVKVRETIRERMEEYSVSPYFRAKDTIARQIIEEALDDDARFLREVLIPTDKQHLFKHEKRVWVEAEKNLVLRKIKQSFRDVIRQEKDLKEETKRAAAAAPPPALVNTFLPGTHSSMGRAAPNSLYSKLDPRLFETVTATASNQHHHLDLLRNSNGKSSEAAHRQALHQKLLRDSLQLATQRRVETMRYDNLLNQVPSFRNPEMEALMEMKRRNQQQELLLRRELALSRANSNNSQGGMMESSSPLPKSVTSNSLGPRPRRQQQTAHDLVLGSRRASK